MYGQRIIIRIALGAALAGGAARMASAQHDDMLLLIDGAGELVTGTYSFDTNTVLSTQARVFEGEFDAFGTIDEPGFNALSSGQVPMGFSALPANSDVTFTANAFEIDSIVSNLWHWDATGPVSFGPVTGGTLLNVSKAPSTVFSADLDGSSGDVPGFVINPTDSAGFLHKHIDFSIIDANTAPAGFYLWSFELEVGGLTSEPVYFVHGLGGHDEALHQEAIEWVEANVVAAPACCPGNGAKESPGLVDFGDITAVLNAWLTDYGTGNTGPGDSNCDGVVNFSDITATLGNWLSVCS